MFRRVLAGFAALLSSLALPAMADEPDGYYEQAYGKSGYALKTALHQIIRDHASLSYDALWDAFRTTDVREDGYVWDMYSDCDFRFGSNQCGNYKQEGDCYNREHSFPKSWFDDARPMYTDLFHLYPTDGYVNGRRSNNPFGEVDVPDYTSQAGCKLGPNATPGYSGTVFEPLDEYKGDFARTYFYMATCYEDRIASWGSCPICNGTDDQSFDDWAVDLLLKWNEQDPVSDKERARNDAVYVYQENRNPFIDYPELAGKIWGDDNTPFTGEETGMEESFWNQCSLRASGRFLQVEYKGGRFDSVEIVDAAGRRICRSSVKQSSFAFTLPAAGVYIVRIQKGKLNTARKISVL